MEPHYSRRMTEYHSPVQRQNMEPAYPPDNPDMQKSRASAASLKDIHRVSVRENNYKNVTRTSSLKLLSRNTAVSRMVANDNLRKQQDKHYRAVFQKSLTFLFSHLGLTSLVVIYAVLGGFLFQFLEGKTEIVERASISKKRNATITKIWLMTSDLNTLHQGNWSIQAEQIIKDFQDDVVVAVKEKGWDGRDESSKELSWSFPGSLLYSINVLTTIGYGNIAPKTQWGRMTTMLYALLGIPLTLLCLSTIGSSWANCFRFLYKYTSLSLARLSTCSGSKEISKITQRSIFTEALNTSGVTVPLWVSLLIIAGYVGGGAVLFSAWEKDWDYLISAYFCFITLSTIGFGDFVFGFGTNLNSSPKLITSSLYLFMGLAIIAMCFNLMQEEAKDRFIRIGLRLGVIKKKKRRTRPR